MNRLYDEYTPLWQMCLRYINLAYLPRRHPGVSISNRGEERAVKPGQGGLIAAMEYTGEIHAVHAFYRRMAYAGLFSSETLKLANNNAMFRQTWYALPARKKNSLPNNKPTTSA